MIIINDSITKEKTCVRVSLHERYTYLFDKKPDSDNRHWKEQQEIQQYCKALGKKIGGKEKQSRKGM